MVTALAFMDLPFVGGDYHMKAVEGRKTEITAGKSNLLIF